jgi:hypothetical protein
VLADSVERFSADFDAVEQGERSNEKEKDQQ